MSEILWKDRKRIIFGLPLSFTKYVLTEDKLIFETGFFNKVEEEIRLYRIVDFTLNRSFGERIFGLGTIHCCSADKSTPEFDIQRVKKPQEVKNLISETVEKCRIKNKVIAREIIDDEHDENEDGLEE